MGTIGETHTLNEPHHQKRIGLVFAHFINRNDVCMIEFGRSFCFPTKAGQRCRRGQVPNANHFHGHKPVQRALAGSIHNAHPSASDSFQDFIIHQTEFPVTVRTGIQKLAVIVIRGLARKPKVQQTLWTLAKRNILVDFAATRRAL